MVRKYSREARRLQPFIALTSGNVAQTEIVRMYGEVSGDLIPDLADARDLGSSEKPWRKGWLSELDAILFAKNTQTLIGGYLVIGKGEGTLAANVAAADTTADFGQAMTVGDFILFRGSGAVEYMQVGALVSGTVYNVTRNLDGSGANDWPAGAVYLVLGTNGNGRLILNATDTPRLQIIQQGATYNVQTEVGRMGDMNGSYDFAAEEYGFGVGDYSGGNYLRYGQSKGFKLAAGDGAVGIDEDGIYITEGIADPERLPVAYAVNWRNGSWNCSRIFSYLYGTGFYNSLVLEADAPYETEGAGYGTVRLRAYENTDAVRSSVFELTSGGATLSSTDGGGADLSVGGEVDAADMLINSAYIHRADGWATTGETWTYASASTFTVPGNVVTKYPTGTKIKLTQTTVKYFYVLSASYSSPNTTITVTGGSDYSLAAAAITANYFSYMATPQGFPGFFNWAPTPTGFSSVPGSSVYQFTLEGRKVSFNVHQGTDGTSNATTFTIPLPITAATGTSWQGACGYAINNGAALTAAARWYIAAGGTAVDLYTNMSNGAWASSNGKRAILQGFYWL